MLTYEALTAIITQCRFVELIGETETDLLEAKSSPYQLDDDYGKSELAKDVSALANHAGGYLIIGVRTDADPTSQADKITALRPFERHHLDANQYRQVLGEWIYPPIDNLTVQWIETDAASQKGFGIITIPPQPGEKKPFMIAKTILDTGKRRDILIGYAQRRHDQVEPLAIERIHQLIRDGMFFESLISQRFDEIHARLDTLTGDMLPPHKPPIEPADVAERINRQVMDAGITGKPYIAFAAYANISLELQTLFNSREGSLGRLITAPPKLRPHGFSIAASDDSQIIGGTFRRSLANSDRLGGSALVIYRDGVLIFVADIRRFSWGMPAEHVLNALSLVEMVYSFCMFFQDILNDAAATPITVTLHARISQAAQTQRLALAKGALSSIQDWGIPPRSIAAACTALDTQLPIAGFDPSGAALKLLEEIYVRFGWETDAIPYVEESDGVRRISAEAIRNFKYT